LTSGDLKVSKQASKPSLPVAFSRGSRPWFGLGMRGLRCKRGAKEWLNVRRMEGGKASSRDYSRRSMAGRRPWLAGWLAGYSRPRGYGRGHSGQRRILRRCAASRSPANPQRVLVELSRPCDMAAMAMAKRASERVSGEAEAGIERLLPACPLPRTEGAAKWHLRRVQNRRKGQEDRLNAKRCG